MSLVPEPLAHRVGSNERPQHSTDGAAIAGMCDSHAPLLRAIARSKFGVPDADVDDLVHDVFTTFLTSPARIKDLRAYLIGGICNASREYWRRQKRDSRLFVDIDPAAVL